MAEIGLGRWISLSHRPALVDAMMSGIESTLNWMHNKSLIPHWKMTIRVYGKRKRLGSNMQNEKTPRNITPAVSTILPLAIASENIVAVGIRFPLMMARVAPGPKHLECQG